MWVCIVVSFFVVGVWLLVKPTKQSKRVVRVTANELTRATPQAERRQKPTSSWEPAPEPGGQIQWYGGGATLNVAGFELRQPAIYASPGRLRGSQWATDPSEVLIAAEVRRPRGAAPEMGYWPWYSRIEPENRYQYLQWLASGKLALPPDEGLLFLYYYGLERRLLHDGKDAEWVLREIVRLRKLDEPRLGTREGNAFRKYSTNLLWFEVARNAAMFNEAAFETICGLTHNWDDEVIAGALSWLVQHRKPLPAPIARWVASMDLESRQSVVIKRSGDKFNQLFEKRYQERFGEGIPLRATGSLRRHTYRPASGGLSEVECHVADVAGENGLFGHLADLWNGCIDDLRGYTKLEIPTRGPMTADAWEAMPEELRGDADHPLAARFHEIVRAAQAAGAGKASRETLIHAGLLASQVGTDRREKLTATQSRRVAATLQHCGYNVEPDARLSGRPYGWDQPVAVFPRTDESEIDPRRYGGAVCMLQLGLTVAEADGVVEPEELRHLAERIDALFQLPPHELRRLDALRAVLLSTGADLAAITKRLEASMSKEAHLAVGRLLVAIAAADGGIEKKEMTALRRCFRALSLPPESLDAVIAELAPVADSGMVTVQVGAGPVAGEAIPPQGGLRLNREAISAIMAETRDVAKLLADAMGPGDEEVEVEEPAPLPDKPQPNAAASAAPSSSSATATASSIPSRYASFLTDLATQAQWSMEEAGGLARKHGLMLAGAIEAINDWSLETHGTPILDESGGLLTVDRSIL